MRRAEERLAALLERPRYEVIPLAGVREQVLAHVPREVKVTVTASPTKGLGPTLELAAALAADGYAVVPHLSARLVRDEEELRAILARLERARIEEAFVVAGDPPRPAGPFEGAADLLRAMDRLGHRLREIGITGYPESHPLIDDETTIQAMFEKAEYATYIASQICFDARVIARWIENVWARGTRLPIYVGVPGVVHLPKLLRVSAKIGLGDSVRFLRKHGARLGRLLVPGAYSPDGLLRDLASALADPEGKVAGLHVFTFNELEATERWRRARLAQLPAAASAG
ncbi:MAG TPA: methylenetetrahydrofolate reductase [Gaiellaceae bacterium]|nr:methylenetetrahydrofolate reductase [Gaiellaceae bacterium]